MLKVRNGLIIAYFGGDGGNPAMFSQGLNRAAGKNAAEVVFNPLSRIRCLPNNRLRGFDQRGHDVSIFTIQQESA
jgi:hypothetical protein